jgi:toxin secretion/phage lysis holin
MNWELFYKTGASVLGAIVGWLFGGWNPMLQVLFAFVVFDYISGLIASGTEGKLNSKIGFIGIFKKIMIFMLVAVGHMIDKTVGQGHLIGDGIVFFYLANELLSIIENAGRAGINVPDVLKNAVQILQGKGDK